MADNERLRRAAHESIGRTAMGGRRHAGKKHATLCGDWDPTVDTVDNVLPDCEPCQLVSENMDGATVPELAASHDIPASLVEDILAACERRRG